MKKIIIYSTYDKIISLHLVNEIVSDGLFKNYKITILDFIPSADSLSRSSFVIREVLGRMYYRIIFLLK